MANSDIKPINGSIIIKSEKIIIKFINTMFVKLYLANINVKNSGIKINNSKLIKFIFS